MLLELRELSKVPKIGTHIFLSLLDPCRWQTCRSMQWTTDLSVCICVFIEYVMCLFICIVIMIIIIIILLGLYLSNSKLYTWK